ncbi:MAG: DUF1800 domain-containing protein [Bacteroidota bacterium]
MIKKLTFTCFFLTISLICWAQINGQGVTPQVTVTTSHDQQSSGAATVRTAGRLPNLAASSRFLAQSTLGGSYETIEATADQGFSNWIDQQMTLPVGGSIEDDVVSMTAELYRQKQELGENLNNVRARLHFFHSAWWQYIMTSPDLLRARVALALSEIFVISEIPNLRDEVLGIANYYDVLLEHSFGNFKDLLTDVTLHPAMGTYLTHVNNPKADPSTNTFPDENYAREIMQLFTIGLYELNIDGTRKLQNGAPIPAYDQDDIQEFAKVFTGLTWFDETRFGRRAPTRESYTMPMRMENSEHQSGAKELLNGFTVPNRNPVDGMADIDDAMQNLFDHPNVGPFLAYRLIQRLVKSNPTPSYVQRVAEAFNNNGQGVRGDMKAVVRAVLLDDEARSCAWIDEPTHGMLREPIVRHTHIARAFDATSVNGHYHTYQINDFYLATGQRPMSSPSVFNFFQTDYKPIGEIADAGLVAPEFQITNASTTMGYANEVNEWTFRSRRALQYGRIYKEEHDEDDYARFDWSDEMALVESGDIDNFVERLNLILMHGRMSTDTRRIIKAAILQVPENNHNERLGMGVYLVMTSPEYLILR